MIRQWTDPWLALAIGNSRLHWGLFDQWELQQTWDIPHLPDRATGQAFLTQIGLPDAELWIASVVPAQTALWHPHSPAHLLTLGQVPLQQTYPTLGIDRAVALWGAISTLGSPVLVIDGGTALTFTGADETHCLRGGAILPGLRLQFQSLDRATAALPFLQKAGLEGLPDRWATSTERAIASGVIYGLLATLESFIRDWHRTFPQSPVVLTGGDGEFLRDCLRVQAPDLATQIVLDPHLIFWGIRAIRTLSGEALIQPS